MVREGALKSILDEVNSLSEESIGVRLPDGTEIPQEPVSHRVVFRSWKALERVFKDPEMGFGEGYVRKDIEIEGDLEKVLVAGNRYINKLEGVKGFSGLIFKFVNRVSLINRLREKENVSRHYDLGDEFYRLWLDESMTYSCAFFSERNMTLESAQREKRRIIYEKLQLRDGDRLLDVGCGWGSILLEVSQLYDIKAVGITLSENQFKHIKEEIYRKGLGDRVEVYLTHYADLPKLGMKFNKVVSVGMFEHVGREHYRHFFNTVNRVMEEGGLFLLHTIGKVHPSVQSRWIRRYIFPGGYLPSIPEVVCAFEGSDFCLIDIDDWRPHYYRTLKEWRKRFWKNIRLMWERYGEEFVRMWDLYLVSSAVSFYTGSNHLFQFLLSKGVKNDYPVIRRELLSTSVLRG